MNLLEVNNLSIKFNHDRSSEGIVKNLNFVIPQNGIVGIAGESGSGKTVTALSILKLFGKSAINTSGEIYWNEAQNRVDLLKLEEEEIRHYRGAKISMIFQEPMSALNPLLTCGFQASEALLAHKAGSATFIKERILECFQFVGLRDLERIYNSYPFELSGGQLQRVLIASAISCNPRLIIADEPTTALDVTLQKQILELLERLRRELQISVLFISHDLGLIQNFCDTVIIMKKGELIEKGATEDIFSKPKQAYTKGLIACRPSLKRKIRRLPTIEDFTSDLTNPVSNQDFDPVSSMEIDNRNEILTRQPELIAIENLVVKYHQSRGFFTSKQNSIRAVNQINLKLRKTETLGLVGESGSGKSTIGKAILNLVKVHSGSIKYNDLELTTLSKDNWRSLRKEMQIIFQDPYSSLNPRQSAGDALIEPMQIHNLYHNKKQRTERAIHLLETVGLDSKHLTRYPHQFSGGQRQRICIARALSLDPKFIVCDEAVSSLDVSIQAQILNLLKELKEKLGLTYLFISHDLAVIHFISDHIAVLKDGQVVEQGPSEQIINRPSSEYTMALLNSALK